MPRHTAPASTQAPAQAPAGLARNRHGASPALVHAPTAGLGAGAAHIAIVQSGKSERETRLTKSTRAKCEKCSWLGVGRVAGQLTAGAVEHTLCLAVRLRYANTLNVPLCKEHVAGHGAKRASINASVQSSLCDSLLEPGGRDPVHPVVQVNDRPMRALPDLLLQHREGI